MEGTRQAKNVSRAGLAVIRGTMSPVVPTTVRTQRAQKGKPETGHHGHHYAHRVIILEATLCLKVETKSTALTSPNSIAIALISSHHHPRPSRKIAPQTHDHPPWSGS